jgi:rSAM/selenodomain-associated transferase 1
MIEQPSQINSGASASCGIAVMAKSSVPGLTKTRLVPPLTYDEAAAFNTAFLKDVAANIGAAARHAAIKGYMAFGPPGSENFFKENLGAEIGLIEVWLPDFGDCLFTAIDRMLAVHRAAVVLNSDSPTLPTALLVETARRLAQPGDRAVIGPSTDGGYYLLGIKERHRGLFECISWSTEHVMRQTLQRAEELGIEMHVLPPWYDVDDRYSLKLLRAELFDGLSFSTTHDRHPARHSTRLFGRLLDETNLAWRLAEGVGAAQGAAA